MRDIRDNLKIEAREKYLAGHFINTIESLKLTLALLHLLSESVKFPSYLLFFLESFIIFSDSLITNEKNNNRTNEWMNYYSFRYKFTFN